MNFLVHGKAAKQFALLGIPDFVGVVPAAGGDLIGLAVV
jgi:hypothetical protein